MYRANPTKIAELLAANQSIRTLDDRICIAGIKLLGADGVSLAVLSSNYISSGASTEKEYRFFDEQQFAYADGPTFDASKSVEPVTAQNFKSKKDQKRWPIFSVLAIKRGLVSMVAFPVHIAHSNLGVISSYRKNIREIKKTEYVDGLALSIMAANLIVQEMAGDKKVEQKKLLEPLSIDQSLLHFAAGKLAEKEGISILESLVRIRAHALKAGQPLLQVAEEIAENNLTIEASR